MENTHGNTRSVVAGEVKALMGRHSVSKAELGKILGHSFGTALYAACHDLVTVQQQMGHCSPQTTRGYVAANDDDARAAIRALYRPGEAAA